MNFLKKDFFEKLLLVFLGVLLGAGVNFALAQWQGPTQPPPQGNLEPPLTQSAVGQAKKGNLTVNLDGAFNVGLTVVGNAMWVPVPNGGCSSSYTPEAEGMICFDKTLQKLQVSVDAGGGSYQWIPVH